MASTCSKTHFVLDALAQALHARRPTQNAPIECFNRTFRTEVLDRYVFTRLPEVRRMTEDWRHRYNRYRPHRSPAGLSPVVFAQTQSPINLYFCVTRRNEDATTGP